MLFRGHRGAHGTHGQEERSAGRVKTEIKKSAKTLREPATPLLWRQHLDGERALGVVPIDSDSTCWWGALDIDKYDLSHQDIARKLEKLGLPLYVCRSKSGGAHLYLFLSEPVAAADLVRKMREWAAAMGFGDCEIFPKQTEVLEDRGDLGNWINMPYYQADGGSRYCVRADGRGMSVDQFMDSAEKSRLSHSQFMALSPGSAKKSEEFSDGPPCLQYLAGIGVAEGGRNNALFAYGVLAKKKHPDDWESILEQWNREILSPPLGAEEFLIVLKSLRKKDYSYRCKDQPICAHCDQSTCRTRKFGIGAGATPDISSISILDTNPPLFFVCLTSGGTVECKADDIMSSRNFQRSALEQLRIMLPLFKQENWQNRITECLEQAVLIEAPREASTTGAFQELLEQFCTDRHAAQDRDEILLGKPWRDEDRERYWFRLIDLMSHLERAKFRELSRTQIVSRIREMGGDSDFFNLRGRGANVWWLPEGVFSMQTISHSVPRAPESPI